jgi:hypothetical protein
MLSELGRIRHLIDDIIQISTEKVLDLYSVQNLLCEVARGCNDASKLAAFAALEGRKK